MGLGLGYLLYKMKDQQKLPLNPMALAWIWAIAFLVGCLVIYGLVPYQKDLQSDAPLAERAIYGGFHRLAWALAVSWVILACIKGAGGPVNSILSWPAWVPLARMSFAIYLVHMTVMSVVNSYASYRVNASQVLMGGLLSLCHFVFSRPSSSTTLFLTTMEAEETAATTRFLISLYPLFV